MPIAGLLAILVANVAVPLRAVAQDREPSDVLLFAPPEVQADWTAALQIALAATGARVIPLAPTPADTALQRDAQAQRLARERGARAAVRLEATEDGLWLRVVDREAPEVRAVPIAREADARMVALILVRMLGVAPVAPARAPVAASPQAHDEELAATATSVEDPEPPPPRPFEMVGLVGAAPLLVVHGQVDLGAFIRGGFGLRVRYFEVGAVGDLGWLIHSFGLAAFGRGCVEVGAAFPEGSPMFHIGGRGCGGAWDGGGLISIGGYVAISVRIKRWLRLRFQGDVDVTGLEHEIGEQIFNSLSMLMTFGR